MNDEWQQVAVVAVFADDSEAARLDEIEHGQPPVSFANTVIDTYTGTGIGTPTTFSTLSRVVLLHHGCTCCTAERGAHRYSDDLRVCGNALASCAHRWISARRRHCSDSAERHHFQASGQRHPHRVHAPIFQRHASWSNHPGQTRGHPANCSG